MTNVVGILVIVLVITRLSVSGAVQRIRQNLPDVSQAMLDETKAAHAKASAELADARKTLALVDQPMDAEAIDAMAAKVDALTKALAEAKLADLAALEADALAKKKVVATMTPQAALLRKQLDVTTEQLALLEQKKPQALKVVNLPNPRAAPQGSLEEHFLVRKNRVLHVPQEALMRLAESRLKQLQLKTDDKGRVDCAQAVELFNRANVGNKDFKLIAKLVSNRLYLVIEPRDENAGETADEIAQRTSLMQRMVRSMANRKAHARFVVWSDSFDAYVAARAQTDALEVPAGWQPVVPNYEWRELIAGALPCIPPEPPKVVPPPPPPPVTTPPPKPLIPPPPAPPKRIPNDDID